jgi:hypothetical protein
LSLDGSDSSPAVDEISASPRSSVAVAATASHRETVY